MKKRFLIPAFFILIAFAVLLCANFALRSAGQKIHVREHEKLLRTILPGSTSFTLESYSGDDESIVSVHKGETGFVVETRVDGYAAPITMLTAVTNDGRVTGLVVCDMHETRTLGLEALTDHVFLSQLLNTSGEARVGENVDALCGATVTSKAVVKSVNSAVSYVTGADVDSAATSWGG